MKRVLILGATGHLGAVLTQFMLEHGYSITALVRNPGKLTIENKNLKIINGDVTNASDLKKALEDRDVVISTLGHGFRTSYPIQAKTLQALLPVMRDKHITRFLTVTGAGLVLPGDSQSLIGTLSDRIFPLIDPYRMSDAKNQQRLLEESNLKWTVVRTPAHSNNPNPKIHHVGLEQPMPWVTLSRVAICQFMVACIEKHAWIRKSPIIY